MYAYITVVAGRDLDEPSIRAHADKTDADRALIVTCQHITKNFLGYSLPMIEKRPQEMGESEARRVADQCTETLTGYGYSVTRTYVPVIR